MELKEKGTSAHNALVLARTNSRYKPVAIKQPFLAAFLSLFVVCICLIELLLAISSRPVSTDEPAASETSDVNVKRAETSCKTEVGWSSQLLSLESSYGQLCSDSSKTLASSKPDQVANESPPPSWSNWAASATSGQHLAIASPSHSTTTSMLAPAPTSVLPTITLSQSVSAASWIIPTQTAETAVSPTRITTSGIIPAQAVEPAVNPTRITASTGMVEEASFSASNLSQSSKLPSVVAYSEKASAAEYTTVTQFTTMIATTEAGKTTSFAAVVKQTVVLDTVPSSTEEGSKATNAASAPRNGKVNFHLSAHEVVIDQPFTNISYFAALYSAPLLAVLIKSAYEIIFAALKLVQPFHYLSSLAGAETCCSVLAQYLSSSMPLDVIGSLVRGHYLPLWSVIMYLLVEVGAPIASAAMSVRARDMCLIDGVERRCDPAWIIDTTVIRILEGLLGLCAVLICVLIVSTWHYTLSLEGNPSSIISLATLLNYEPFLLDLIQIDPEAGDFEFNCAFREHRFWLAEHQNTVTSKPRYGIISCAGPNAQHVPQINHFGRPKVNDISAAIPAAGINTAAPRSLISSSFHSAISNRRLRALSTDTVCLLTCLAFFSILLAYILDYRADRFNSFFNSQKILPKIIFIGLAILVDGQVKHLERVIRIIEPYRRLSFGYARAETTILLPLNGTCWSNLPRCIYYLLRYSDSRMLWQTTASIVTCLSDFNIVAAAGVLFTDSQTPEAFQVCSYIAAVITSCILLMVLVTLLWWRRVNVVRDMPRVPDTIGAVLSYLCGSATFREWLVEMELEDMSEKQRNRTIIESGRRFKFGKMLSTVDEKMRWCVDFDDDVEHDRKVDMNPRRTSW